MSRKTSFLIATSFTALLGAVAPADAWADNDHRGRGRGHERHDDRHDHDGKWKKHNHYGFYARPRYAPPRIVYYNYTPPRTTYRVIHAHPYVGHRLVHYYPVPQHVLYRLQPAPYGYYYSYMDDNVFLVRQQDNIVMQIIAMLTGQ